VKDFATETLFISNIFINNIDLLTILIWH